MYDLIVIGAGSAGLTAAEFAAQLGATVALVERREVGGDCTWVGCVPSKALLYAAKVAHTVRTAARFGVRVAAPAVDLSAVKAYVSDAIQDVYRRETPAVLAEAGIEVVAGDARFLDAHTIQVGARQLRARRFVIATGACPATPAIAGLAETPFLTYEQIFTNEQLPQRLLVLGAGPTGVELAQAYGRFGADVVLIDTELLPVADPAVGRLVRMVLQREGVRFVAGLARAVSFGRENDRFVVAVDGVDGSITGDMLLVTTGRRPRVAGLALEQAGVVYDRSGIHVNDQLQTTTGHIYGAGDCTGGPQFTHYAGWQGFQAARNALLPGRDRGVKTAVPWTVFTDPEIAHVGLSAGAAKKQHGDRVCVSQRPLSRVDRAVTHGATDGFITLVHREDGALLGATIVAERAGEMINELALALEHGLSVRDVANSLHVYPTFGIGMQRLSAEVATARFLQSFTGRLARRLAQLQGFVHNY